MNLYLIEQDVNDDWDTYDSAVVCAPDAESARHIHPDPNNDASTWCDPEHVRVTLIGKAHAGIEEGVVLASYNAG